MEYRPRIVSWNITGACHLRCPHCYLDARRRWPGELSTKEGLRLIDEAAEAGTELLILTGGEPLLRQDFPLLASHAASQGIAVVLGTTGTLITRQRARLMKENGILAAGISLDSLEPSKHDAFRGMPGAWRKAVNGIEICREEGLEVLVHTTALKMNQQEVPDLVRFAHQRGARAFQLFFLVCTGRGEQLTDLSPKEYEGLFTLLLEAQERHPGLMIRARCAPYIGRLAVERGLPPMGSAGCLAGTSYCRITPAGDVTPCPYLPTVAGNVREQSFQDIWDSSPVLTSFRRPVLHLGGKCGECPLSQGEDPICVGCRARALALAGDAFAADPWCLFEPPQPTEQPLGEAREVSAAPMACISTPLQTPMTWTEKAKERLERTPFFIRQRVKQAAEVYVQQQGLWQITPEVLDHLRQRTYGGSPPPIAAHPLTTGGQDSQAKGWEPSRSENADDADRGSALSERGGL